MRRTPIALAAILALGGLGACGDDDAPEESAVTTTSESEDSDAPTSTSTSVEEGDLERDDPGADNTTPSQGLIELEATLEAVPSSGGANGSGLAAVQVDVNNRELCFTIGTESVENATAAHIHDGLEGEEGTLVVALAPPQNGSVDGCVRKLQYDLATKLAGNPERYYIDVHSENAPSPALRGQLEAMP